MRTLLVFALILVSAGGYLAYFNTEPVQITVAPERTYQVALGPLLLACVAVGLAMGIAGSLVRDARHAFHDMGVRRRQRQGDRIDALFHQAENERVAGRAGKARDLYRKVTKLNPEHVPAITRLGELAREAGAHKEAITLHRLAFRLDPDDPSLLLAMVDDYVAMEAYESAVQLLHPALEEDPKNQTFLIRLREVHAAAGEWREAADAQERLIHTPMYGLDSRVERDLLTGYRYEAAMALLADGKSEQGRSALSNLVRSHTTFSPAYMALGEALLREGRVDDALRIHHQGYEQTRNESFLPHIENLYIVHKEDPREALRVFTALVDRDPKSFRLRYYLGRIYYRLEMIDDAFHIFTQLEQQTEAFPEVQEMLGRIHLRRKHVDEALEALGETGPAAVYACAGCGHGTEGWQARCGACGAWGHVSPQLGVRPEQGMAAATPALLPAPG